MKPILVSVACLAALLLAPQAFAQGDADKGKLKAYTCTGCHGIEGYKNVYPHYHVPKIGGQNFDYLVIALTAYQKGERKHPTMQAQAESFTAEDIADLSAYLTEAYRDEAVTGSSDATSRRARRGEALVALAAAAKEAASSAAAGAASPKAEAGRAKSTACQACHGADGNGIGDENYPLLAGQYADYLAKALKDYRSGARPNAIMAGFAGTLSDEDIADIAAFYAAQKGPLGDLSHTK